VERKDSPSIFLQVQASCLPHTCGEHRTSVTYHL
jgi:hypothetical protein